MTTRFDWGDAVRGTYLTAALLAAISGCSSHSHTGAAGPTMEQPGTGSADSGSGPGTGTGNGPGTSGPGGAVAAAIAGTIPADGQWRAYRVNGCPFSFLFVL